MKGGLHVRRSGKWVLVALAAAAAVLTLVLALGWTSSGLAGDISVLAANAAFTY